jgi:glycosyltransferase involved in cell wall biosynthesis/SAM-dependent methyltransferase
MRAMTLRHRYDTENAEVFSAIPTTIYSLLDVGCGTGALMRWVQTNIGKHVHLEGITYSDEEAAVARLHADRIRTGDLNDFDFDSLGRFDCIVCSHVLEHLNWPERILSALKPHLAEGGCMIVALPNALQYKLRWQFLRGRFRYTDQGPMDRTHFRFFDSGSAREMVRNAGYQIQSLRTPGHLPLPGIRRIAEPLAKAADGFASAQWPGLFALQFVMRCGAERVRATARREALPVSVVLTTYNRAGLVGQTIESILNQTFRDFELIICDDCSPDSTESVCREYARRDPRVRYIRNETNLGMPGNLNAGILASSGIYIANLHDGDLYHPTLLEKWKNALDESPNAAFVFNRYRIVDAAGHEVTTFGEVFPRSFSGGRLIEEYFRRWRFDSPVYGTVMARRSAYREAGFFDPRFRFIADVDMWLRLAEGHDVAYVPEPLIDIPARDVLPSNWDGWHSTSDHRMLRRIMWEARLRHCRNPLRKALEVVRHGLFSAANDSWLMLVRARHSLRRAMSSAHASAH